MDERVHDRPAHGVEGRGISTRTTGKRLQHAERLDPLAPALSPRRAAARIAAAKNPSPAPSSASSAIRSCSERNGSFEQGELEAVERLTELAVVVRERQLAPELRAASPAE